MKSVSAEAGIDRRPPPYKYSALISHTTNQEYSPNSIRPEDGDTGSSLMVEYYRTIVRYRRLILTIAVCGAIAGIFSHLTTQPIYRTRTSLDIQSLNGDFMNMRSIDPTGASSSETNVQTQIKLLQSDSLMDRVRAKLTSEAHQDYIERTDLLSQTRRTLHLNGSQPIPFPALLDETIKLVKVKPLGLTRLVEVSCDSWDAAFAAHFCNTLTSEFQAQDLESRGSEAKRTSDWLMRQASDIRQKAENSEQRLMSETGGNGLILSQESNTVGEDHLRQLQGELVKAQADRMEKEAQARVAETAAVELTPTVVNDATYTAAQAKLAELRNQVAALIPPLTEANPKIIHLRSEIRQAEETIAKAGTDSAKRLHNEYMAAKHREELLTLAYHSQEASVSSDLEKGSKVALLRREVESEQQLYQTLLQRAKEAGFASAMQASTIRIVDEARTPHLPVYPQHLTTTVIGLILGSFSGLAIAFFKDRNVKVLRMPGDSAQLLHIHELGVIPSPTSGGNMISARSGSNRIVTTIDLSSTVTKSRQKNAMEAVGWNEQFSLVAEAYRNTTHSLLLSDSIKGARIYVISSPGASEGKTTVTSNLGIALSKSKLRVVLIDGDLRKPSLHKALSVSNEIGLRDVLRGEVNLSDSSLMSFCKPTAFPKLSVIPSGKGHEEVVELLHSSRLSDLLERLTHEFDVILVDTPPMLHMADARIIAGHTNGAILILRSGVTKRDEAVTALSLLNHDRVPVVGTVLNDFNPTKEGKSSYYSSYYAYKHNGESEDHLAVSS
ncbi:polysaccharide biosynthesis tyrosine autokinase [Granulicella sp. dw_53]|uniref:GumC family protein n=1 Tax=Granulicella sp. dw_53 TaxID=2719792 RepID=UPI001BD5BC70|nr:polysaccharide biosynthesis tyrosine autokinase [Granulicella sp. dw_53]